MAQHVVVGLDAGGTSTRCAAVSPEGGLLGYGRAPGANAFSSGGSVAALTQALRGALSGIRGAEVSHAVFGLAGAATAGRDRSAAVAQEAWDDLGLPGAPRVIDDIAVAFAAGSAAEAGAVLIAGTGAVAARVRCGAVVRRSDGNGWLLGDEGSSVWLALAGLRAALAALDGRGGPTSLSERLAARLKVPAHDPAALVRAAHARAPAELGGLAPEVGAAAAEGDPAAERIVADAGRRLLASLAAVDPDSGGEPVVLAGGVLEEGPVADAVRGGLREGGRAEPLQAVDGALGAAGLALRDRGSPPQVHAALLRHDSR
ncbi:N-acetylglucosamine kinase [Streptomonospora wellingtoniae]|uniref:BadF/BadG/BcrA/BcrD ATPase family protein n=1 Tax=Streptomonospora wellingtoniae TaxID=3075544 RepID=A0ABU2KT49_9ACTN|nr:BadF/BadG/BcrA/BcrD ATPase family protein [Streptomonospora sp. DSM 45055]MDT0302442.1 BadF/BadG/BcrA/BcrD ATPase family protein [Streptomonospora sp. DSM 45055]